jgi:hypothetical protein
MDCASRQVLAHRVSITIEADHSHAWQRSVVIASPQVYQARMRQAAFDGC